MKTYKCFANKDTIDFISQNDPNDIEKLSLIANRKIHKE